MCGENHHMQKFWIWDHFGFFQLQKQPFLWALQFLKFRFWLVFGVFFDQIELEGALRLEIRQTFFCGRSEYFAELEKNLLDFEKKFFMHIFAVEVLYAAIAFLGEKTRFPSSLEQMVATGATNGTKWFLQL